MKITIAQLNPIIGDFKGNLKKIEDTMDKVKNDYPDLIIFSELFLTGYPPLDLLERNDFINKAEYTLQKLVTISKQHCETAILCGTIRTSEQNVGKKLFNSAVVIHNGKIVFQQNKSLLPTYDVFDEARYFNSATQIDIFSFKNEKLGITICEDAWNNPETKSIITYPVDPIKLLIEKGATFIINISASPFHIGKEEMRYSLIRNQALKHNKPIILINQVGGNDELIFDGRSMFFNNYGDLLKIFPPFQEHIETIDYSSIKKTIQYIPQNKIESVYDALILGLRDYMLKCGFDKAVLGLSGGIDSALVCCLASSALGPENVLGIAMPSVYSSKESLNDARQLSFNLGIKFQVIPITLLFNDYLKTLTKHFEGKSTDITEENIQARIRGNILMAMSNKLNMLTLSTGNKSELSVGYCTLYGDMSGGLSVIADVPKTMVYSISEYINREQEIIPINIINKPPSAELKPDQKDQDTLPPYEKLDQILSYLLDEGLSKQDVINKGMDPVIVDWVIKKVFINEYKRRQAAPGLKVTSKAFGIGRRMPIASKFYN
jgi:NAD+ synthase (glutamine-hydrolysing)